MEAYTETVQALLRLGEPSRQTWADYRTYGLGPQHIPELIRLATDPVGFEGDPDSPEVWGPVHAWRALGQLCATEAVPALLELLDRQDQEHDDMVAQDVPDVLAQIGPAVLPSLAAFLATPGRGLYACWNAADALVNVVAKYPECRQECVEILSQALERSIEDEDPERNAVFIGCLAGLRATEALPVIDRAFATEMVETIICGDREDVQYELGLRTDPPPRQRGGLLEQEPRRPGRHWPTPKQRAQERRRQAKQARKRNRKKK